MAPPRTLWMTAFRWLRRLALLVILALLLWFVVIPQLGEAQAGFAALHSISIPLIALAVACEVVSLLVLGLFARSVLNPATRPGYFTVLRVRFTDLGVNNVVPGGGVVALAVRYRLLTQLGMNAGDVLSSAGIEITMGTLVLGVVFGIGVTLSVPSAGASFYPYAATVIGGVFVLALVAFVLLLYYREHTHRIIRSLGRRFPSLPQQSLSDFIDSVADNLAAFASNRRRLVATTIWALANWLFDAASLWVFLLAFGHSFPIGQLLLAYGLASLLGMLPITPGGLGVIEGVLVPALVGFAAPHTLVVLGVVAWRLVEFWLPIPVSLIAYGSLRAGVLRRSRSLSSSKRASLSTGPDLVERHVG
ncbi:MAG: YbhN family protein [Actinomycetota bacterium]